MKGLGLYGRLEVGHSLRGPAYLVASSLEVNPLALRKNKKVRWQKLYPQPRMPQMALEVEVRVNYLSLSMAFRVWDPTHPRTTKKKISGKSKGMSTGKLVL